MEGHTLLPEICGSGGAFYCDPCGGQIEARSVYNRCRPCNYDVCEVCRARGEPKVPRPVGTGAEAGAGAGAGADGDGNGDGNGDSDGGS